MRNQLIKLALPCLIRAVVTAAMLYGVYHETGPFTVGTFALIWLWIEQHSAQHTLEKARKILFGPLSELRDIFREIAQKR